MNLKYVEIFTDGSINFSYKGLKFSKQAIFYKKDFANSVFFKRSVDNYSTRNASRNSYKSKYKF